MGCYTYDELDSLISGYNDSVHKKEKELHLSSERGNNGREQAKRLNAEFNLLSFVHIDTAKYLQNTNSYAPFIAATREWLGTNKKSDLNYFNSKVAKLGTDFSIKHNFLVAPRINIVKYEHNIYQPSNTCR